MKVTLVFNKNWVKRSLGVKKTRYHDITIVIKKGILVKIKAIGGSANNKHDIMPPG